MKQEWSCFIVLEEHHLNISLGKFEMINYYVVGDLSYTQSYTVKDQSNGRSLPANDFTILSERTLLIQKFVEYLGEACTEKELLFFYFLLVETIAGS